MPVNRWHVRLARREIIAGGVIAYPTEGVYGLGCDPDNRGAVERLLSIKHRDAARGFILIAAALEQLAPYIEPLSRTVEDRLARTWPGPVTWLLPAAPGTPDWLTGGRDTIATRVSAHPLVSALCCACDRALTSTSANLGGHPPARSALEVRARLGARIDHIVPGRLGGRNRPTEIRDGEAGKIIRPG